MSNQKIVVGAAVVVVAYLLATRTCKGREVVARVLRRTVTPCCADCAGGPGAVGGSVASAATLGDVVDYEDDGEFVSGPELLGLPGLNLGDGEGVPMAFLDPSTGEQVSVPPKACATGSYCAPVYVPPSVLPPPTSPTKAAAEPRPVYVSPLTSPTRTDDAPKLAVGESYPVMYSNLSAPSFL